MTDAGQAQFEIVFRGDIVPGQQIEAVKQRMAQMFKTDGQRINALFSGRPVVLKGKLDAATAKKYKIALEKAGAQVDICPDGSVRAKPAQKPRERKPRPERSRVVTSLTAENSVAEPEEIEEEKPPEYGLNLAPVGTDLLYSHERSANEVEVVEVDTSALSVAPLSGDLLQASEKAVVETLEVDVDFGIAEVGADMLTSEFRPQQADVVVDIAGLDLAPAGSDMGQAKTPPAPPPPDTSSIKLANQ